MGLGLLFDMESYWALISILKKQKQNTEHNGDKLVETADIHFCFIRSDFKWVAAVII